jgi:hypothetical protein
MFPGRQLFVAWFLLELGRPQSFSAIGKYHQEKQKGNGKPAQEVLLRPETMQFSL